MFAIVWLGEEAFNYHSFIIIALLLYTSGNETKDVSKAHLSTVAQKPEETCKQGRLLCEPETQGKPLLFHDKCSGFFYVHHFNNLVHGTYGLTSHPKDEAIMVKCPAQGHKRHDRLGRDSNSHSDNSQNLSFIEMNWCSSCMVSVLSVRQFSKTHPPLF